MPTYSSSVGNGYRLHLTVNVTSQNVGKNTSSLSWYLEIETGHTYYNARQTGEVFIAGTRVWSVSGVTFNSAPSRNRKRVASGSRTVSHNSNGSLSVQVLANLRTVQQGSSWSLPRRDLSGTYRLPDINRLPGKAGVPTVTLDQSDRRIYVQARNQSGATGYQISWRRRRNGVWNDWANVTADANRRWNIAGGTAPVTYQFRSRHRNSAGWGGWSDIVSRDVVYRPNRSGIPSVSQNVLTRLISVTAPVTAAAGTPITNYQIGIRDVTDNVDWIGRSAADRTYSFIPPKPDHRYEFRARAQTAAGYGDWSGVVIVTGLPSGPIVRHQNAWKRTQAYVNDRGTWKKAIAFVKSGTTWREARR